MLGTTYVYATTETDDSVGVRLRQVGLADLSARLVTTSLSRRETDRRIVDVPRMVGGGMYGLDVPFSVAGTYVAALQIMVRGKDFDSMIWWRWQAAQQDVGTWYTDHTSHSCTVDARGRRYGLRITGKGTVGFDDIYVALRVV